MTLLDGEGTRNRAKEASTDERRRRDEEETISAEEVANRIGKAKGKKAASADGLPNEAWKLGGRRVQGKTEELVRDIWEGEGFPDKWREGIIAPIHKKGDMDSVGNYRGITILPSLYRIYASILAGKLERETEEKRCVPENQTGFRRKRGTIENIYVLNHIVGRELKKKGGKVVAMFVDLKAAFDTVDRRKLWEAMEKHGISERLRKRIQEIYVETTSRVRIGQEMGREFWTTKGVRQGCPQSPGLFNLFTADLEGVLERGQEGGVVAGGKKIWSLAYADDIDGS